jgi:hypothetical protein
MPCPGQCDVPGERVKAGGRSAGGRSQSRLTSNYLSRVPALLSALSPSFQVRFPPDCD